jgi:hypothetical protein
MTQYLGVDPFSSSDRSQLDKLPEPLHRFLPECFDREAFLAFRHPPEVFGAIWSNLVAGSCQLFDSLPQERVLTISYEAFCKTPKQHLKTLCQFLGIQAEEAWLTQCASQVKPATTSWLNLPENEQTALNQACQLGLERMKKLFI